MPLVGFGNNNRPQSNLERGCFRYTVKPNDTLWALATDLLGDGERYEEIIEQNKDAYPSLTSSNNLDPGWELKYDCENEEEIIETEGFIINVKVVDDNGNPVEGAKVTIHSKVQEAVTDSEGIAHFTDVEPGDHRVIVAYDGFEGEQALTLTGDVKEYNLNITVEKKTVVFSTQSKVIIGVMSLIILALIVILIKQRRKQ
ncbi:MAG: carboxypeptidase regulatory-like domain-containing protein [Weeksellaceae bacterium]